MKTILLIRNRLVKNDVNPREVLKIANFYCVRDLCYIGKFTDDKTKNIELLSLLSDKEIEILTKGLFNSMQKILSDRYFCRNYEMFKFNCNNVEIYRNNKYGFFFSNEGLLLNDKYELKTYLKEVKKIDKTISKDIKLVINYDKIVDMIFKTPQNSYETAFTLNNGIRGGGINYASNNFKLHDNKDSVLNIKVEMDATEKEWFTDILNDKTWSFFIDKEIEMLEQGVFNVIKNEVESRTNNGNIHINLNNMIDYFQEDDFSFIHKSQVIKDYLIKNNISATISGSKIDLFFKDNK